MLFVQAAQVIMMRPKNWHKFSFGAWLEAAATRMQHNKLGVALANKLARIAWNGIRRTPLTGRACLHAPERKSESPIGHHRSGH